MSEYILSFNPGGIQHFPIGIHHPATAIFVDGTLEFAVEEERYTREKYAYHTFPQQGIQAALDHVGISLTDVDQVAIPWRSELEREKLKYDLWLHGSFTDGTLNKVLGLAGLAKDHLVTTIKYQRRLIRDRLADIRTPVPPINHVTHHQAHAASAFHFAPFNDAIVITADGKGEHESTVVWTGSPAGLQRVRSYPFPNSLGRFYRAFCEYLGYSRKSRAEGKLMALAPYGNQNQSIRSQLDPYITVGADYDVSYFADRGADGLESIFARAQRETPGDFSKWEIDLAFTTQQILEEIVQSIVEAYISEVKSNALCLAGGVMLNCKLNQRLRNLDVVEQVFVQPAAHDGGTVLGAGVVTTSRTNHPPMETAYWGPKYSCQEIRSQLEECNIPYETPKNLEQTVATELASGAVVGWFQGRMEFGPRALGHRSILADPRSENSREKINKCVKHREQWRPFSPSILAAKADEYLCDVAPAQFMIETFDVQEDISDRIKAVTHPADQTVRPQLVDQSTAPRYYKLIKEFEKVTDVPLILNTSFNDSGEPIVNTPTEALRDFFSMALDILVLEDSIVRKSG